MAGGERREEHAILLRREVSDEADERLALLGEDTGLFWVTAKGGKKSKRRFMGVLEPFTRGTFRMARYKRTEYLEAVEMQGARDRIPRDLGRYYVACYACEAVSKLLRAGHPAPGVFTMLAALLTDIQESEEVAHMLWRALFEAALLEYQGLFPELDPELGELDTLVYELDTDRWVPPGAPASPQAIRVEVPRESWLLFTELRDLSLPEARSRAPDMATLRPVNRMTAMLFRYHLQLELNSSRLLNQFQKKALESAG